MNNSGALITRGLGLPADQGLIIGHFRLGGFSAQLRTSVTGGGGGSVGKFTKAGHVAPHYHPIKHDVAHKDYVIIRIRFDGLRQIEREYLVRRRVGDMFVKVINISNTVKDGISALATKFGQSWQNLKVSGKIKQTNKAEVKIEVKMKEKSNKPTITATNLKKEDK